MIKILIAEDSLTITSILQKIFTTDKELFVIGTAKNGKEAVEKTKTLKPDVVTMDIRMPLMDGFEATKEIMTSCPTPILVISASAVSDATVAFNAIKAGALDVVEKPKGNLTTDYEGMGSELIRKVKLISGIKVFHHVSSARLQTQTTTAKKEVIIPQEEKAKSNKVEIVAIASSTGGPSALLKVFKDLPKDFPVPILVVQHISHGFGQGFVDWLNKECKINIKTAERSEKVEAGTIYVAPDDFHMLISEGGIIRLNKSLPIYGLRPAADITIESVAEIYGKNAMGVILTGMGRDGATGLKKIKDKGGVTVAQDESTCVVFGMPKEAIMMGAIDHVLPIDNIAETMIKIVKA
jgi:two-component system chemotaxis response regulator CheB